MFEFLQQQIKSVISYKLTLNSSTEFVRAKLRKSSPPSIAEIMKYNAEIFTNFGSLVLMRITIKKSG